MPRRIDDLFDGSTATVASSSAGGALSVVLSADSDERPGARIHAYREAPAVTTTLTVYEGTSSGGVVFRTGMGSSGHLDLPFSIRVAGGSDMTIVLSSGSSGAGYLNVLRSG